MNDAQKAWVRPALVVVLSTALSLCGAEAVVRVIAPQYPSIYLPDDSLFMRLAPGGRKTYVHSAGNGGAHVAVSIDADGFRGPPLMVNPSRRVVVYGDSFIEGEFSPDSETYVGDLERLLRSDQSGIEAVNAGVVGYGPDQELLKMRRETARLKPSLIVLALFAENDWGDLVRNHIFRLDAGGRLVRTRPVLDPGIRTFLYAEAHPTGLARSNIVRLIERRRGVKTEGEGLLDGSLRFSVQPSADQLASGAPRIPSEDYQYYVVQANDTVRGLLGDYYDTDVAATPDAPSARYKVSLMSAVLTEVRRFSDSASVPIVVVVIPSAVDVCNRYDMSIDPHQFPLYDRSRLATLMKSAALGAGLRTVSLYESFRDRDACALYYRFGNTHWNGQGQNLAAQVTADSLARWGILAGRTVHR